MDEAETPFAHVPAPSQGMYEPPSAIGPVGQIAFFGHLARGLRSRSRIVRYTVALLVLAFFVLPAAALVVWLASSN